VETPAEPEIPPAEPPAPAAESITPAESPPLPPIDSLTHESDFTPFLRQGVPAALRNAALRRLWSDPAIRDAIGPARDYAWDWNVPGGAPGSGAPPTEEEIRSVLAQLRGATPAETSSGNSWSGSAGGLGNRPPRRRRGSHKLFESPTISRAGVDDGTRAVGAFAAWQASPNKRRHGSATPT
jgi:hypothetical protein